MDQSIHLLRRLEERRSHLESGVMAALGSRHPKVDRELIHDAVSDAFMQLKQALEKGQYQSHDDGAFFSFLLTAAIRNLLRELKKLGCQRKKAEKKASDAV